MALNLRDIDYFLAVARTGLMAQAAQECGVTQPALTKAVQRLEAEFALQLFERTGRGMRLSSAGARFHEQALRLQVDYEDTKVLANEMRALRSGLLRIGVTEATAGNLVVPSLVALIPDRPGLRIELHMGRSDAMASAVRAGDVDLALVPSYPGRRHEGDQTLIADDPLLPVSRAAHPLTTLPRIALKDLSLYGWIFAGAQSDASRVISEVFAKQKLQPPRVVVETPHASEATMSLLATTDLISLVPASMLRDRDRSRFRVLPVAQLHVPRAVVLLSRTGSLWSPLMTVFKEALMRERSRILRARTARSS